MELRQLHSPQAQVQAQQDKPRNEKLWKACVQFEALFAQQMLSAMHKTVPDSGFLPNGFAQGVHNDMFNQAVAENIAKSGHTGIATALYRQIAQLAPVQETADHADTNKTIADSTSQEVVTDGTN